MSSGMEKVGAAMMAPVGSYVMSFRIIRLRLTTSRQRPLYLLLEIQLYQYAWVSCCWVSRMALVMFSVVWFGASLRMMKETAWPSQMSILATTPSPNIPGFLTLLKRTMGQLSSQPSPRSMLTSSWSRAVLLTKVAVLLWVL